VPKKVLKKKALGKKVKKIKAEKEEKIIDEILGETKATPLSGKQKLPKTWLGYTLRALLSLVVILVVAIVVFGIGIYAFSWNDQITKTVKQWIPYPALIINYFNISSLSAFDDEVKYVESLYGPASSIVPEKEKIDFSTEEGQKKLREFKKQILDKMVENSVTEQLAAKYNVGASQKEIDDLYNQYYETYKKQGFDISAIPAVKNKFRIQVLKNKLAETVPLQVRASHILIALSDKAGDEEIAQAQKKAEDVLAQVKKNGNFAELAKKYSDDPGSRDVGGDLGWFGRGEMVKEFEDAAFALKKGEISNLVRTQYGFHIIRVEDKRGSVDKNFKEWLNEQVANAVVWKFVSV